MWGIDNKEAPLRVASAQAPSNVVTNMEVKSFDHTANIYHAVAATLACGAEGLKKEMKLPPPF